METGFECKETILVFELYHSHYPIPLGLNVPSLTVGTFEHINLGLIVRLELGG